jgi:2,4-dienoyl-CoA reductase-like NADH-dependent reductase (Old Yellow Enzyme family)
MTRSPQALFTPFSIKGIALPNRIVMAPMTRSFSPGGVPGEDVAAYYRRRAEGGVGLIVTEGTCTATPRSKAGGAWSSRCTPGADTSSRRSGTSAYRFQAALLRPKVCIP